MRVVLRHEPPLLVELDDDMIERAIRANTSGQICHQAKQEISSVGRPYGKFGGRIQFGLSPPRQTAGSLGVPSYRPPMHRKRSTVLVRFIPNLRSTIPGVFARGEGAIRTGLHPSS